MLTLEWSSMSGSTSLKSWMLRPWRRRNMFEISILINLASFLVTAYSFAIWGGLQCLLLMGWQDEDCDSWSGCATAFESFEGDLEVSVRRLTTCFRWVGIACVRFWWFLNALLIPGATWRSGGINFEVSGYTIDKLFLNVVNPFCGGKISPSGWCSSPYVTVPLIFGALGSVNCLASSLYVLVIWVPGIKLSLIAYLAVFYIFAFSTYWKNSLPDIVGAKLTL